MAAEAGQVQQGPPLSMGRDHSDVEDIVEALADASQNR